MGREYISASELKPIKCPYCGSKRIKIYGARKMIYEEEIDGETLRTIEATTEYTDIEWDVIYGVECAECGEDLSELVGL